MLHITARWALARSWRVALACISPTSERLFRIGGTAVCTNTGVELRPHYQIALQTLQQNCRVSVHAACYVVAGPCRLQWNAVWQSGQTLFCEEVNHLCKQAEWNLLWHVLHSSLGRWRVVACTTA